MLEKILKIVDYQAFGLECEFSESSLWTVLYQCFRKDIDLKPVEYLSWSLIHTKTNYEIFIKDLFAIVGYFKESRLLLSAFWRENMAE